MKKVLAKEDKWSIGKKIFVLTMPFLSCCEFKATRKLNFSGPFLLAGIFSSPFSRICNNYEIVNQEEDRKEDQEEESSTNEIFVSL